MLLMLGYAQLASPSNEFECTYREHYYINLKHLWFYEGSPAIDPRGREMWVGFEGLEKVNQNKVVS